MTLTPEERRKIYEEEKARIESDEKEQSKRVSSTSLQPNVAGLLCYLGWWVSGIVFIVLEQKNRLVRFHAMQSIITFGGLTVLFIVLGLIPFAGWIIMPFLGLAQLILWILLMVKAYNGEYFKLPVIGDLAEKNI